MTPKHQNNMNKGTTEKQRQIHGHHGGYQVSIAFGSTPPIDEATSQSVDKTSSTPRPRPTGIDNDDRPLSPKIINELRVEISYIQTYFDVDDRGDVDFTMSAQFRQNP